MWSCIVASYFLINRHIKSLKVWLRVVLDFILRILTWGDIMWICRHNSDVYMDMKCFFGLWSLESWGHIVYYRCTHIYIYYNPTNNRRIDGTVSLPAIIIQTLHFWELFDLWYPSAPYQLLSWQPEHGSAIVNRSCCHVATLTGWCYMFPP